MPPTRKALGQAKLTACPIMGIGLVAFEPIGRTRTVVRKVANCRSAFNLCDGLCRSCPATQSVVNVRFCNSDNTGTHAQVKFEIHRTNIVTGGNDVIFSFNSNGLGAGSGFTTASIAPNIDFDFGNYVYWIEGTVFRDDAGQFADLGSIEVAATRWFPSSISVPPEQPSQLRTFFNYWTSVHELGKML